MPDIGDAEQVDEIAKTGVGSEKPTIARNRYFTLYGVSTGHATVKAKGRSLTKGKLKLPSLPLPYTTEDSEGGVNPFDYQVVALENEWELKTVDKSR